SAPSARRGPPDDRRPFEADRRPPDGHALGPLSQYNFSVGPGQPRTLGKVAAMPHAPPNPPRDAFDVLGVPATFDLFIPQLRAAFLARSAAIHPDLATDDTEA